VYIYIHVQIGGDGLQQSHHE